MNPYEPPPPIKYSPFWMRFRNAMARARRAYRAGLERENISPGQHLRTWLSAFGALALVMFIGVVILINIWRHYG